MLILHGEHEIKSRQYLIEQIEIAKNSGRVIVWLDGKKLTLGDLEVSLGSSSLFDTPQTVIIEQLFSGLKSKRKDELITWLKQILDQNSYPQINLILWENKSLTPAQIKNFSKAKIDQFKLASAVFSWLDQLSPAPASKKFQLKSLQKAVAAESAEFCLIMLIRQLRMLIQAKDHCLPPTAPFMASKLDHQASLFNSNQLIELHGKIFEIDRRLKNGLSPANLGQELEFLILKL